MPRYIIKLNDKKLNRDWYLEWSTIVDAPVTFGCTLKEFKEYYREEYGRDGMSKLDDILKRVEEKGTSGHAPFDSLKDLLSNNRAGIKGQHLNMECILDEYCRRQPEAIKSHE